MTAWSHLPNSAHIDRVLQFPVETSSHNCDGVFVTLMETWDHVAHPISNDQLLIFSECSRRSNGHAANIAAMWALVYHESCASYMTMPSGEALVLIALKQDPGGLLLWAWLQYLAVNQIPE
jgi:hypothetical protein